MESQRQKLKVKYENLQSASNEQGWCPPLYSTRTQTHDWAQWQWSLEECENMAFAINTTIKSAYRTFLFRTEVNVWLWWCWHLRGYIASVNKKTHQRMTAILHTTSGMLEWYFTELYTTSGIRNAVPVIYWYYRMTKNAFYVVQKRGYI